jgi:hypothetical protein
MLVTVVRPEPHFRGMSGIAAISTQFQAYPPFCSVSLGWTRVNNFDGTPTVRNSFRRDVHLFSNIGNQAGVGFRC